MPRMIKKPKVAIVSLSSCQGCQFAILDLGLEFIELLNYLTIKKFRLLKEDDKNENYDLIFVEGTPIREEEEKMLLKLRAKSKFLVALGNCASMGGIQKIKNYRNRKKVASYVYKYYKTIHNREIKELGKIIKVDAVIPGCPINAKDFLQMVYNFLFKKMIKSYEQPVCYECQINKYKCLLKEKKICFGPWTRGGCEAICLKNNFPCLGCRGLLKEIDVSKMMKILKNLTRSSEDEIKNRLEIFGIRDEIEKDKNKI